MADGNASDRQSDVGGQCTFSPSAGALACSRSVALRIRRHVSAPARSPSSSTWSARAVLRVRLTLRFSPAESDRIVWNRTRPAPTLRAWTMKLWTEPSEPPFGSCTRRPSGPAVCRRFATEWRFLIRRPRSRPGWRANSPRAAPPVINTNVRHCSWREGEGALIGARGRPLLVGAVLPTVVLVTHRAGFNCRRCPHG